MSESVPQVPQPERTPFELAVLDGVRRGDDDAVVEALLANELVIPAHLPPSTDDDGDTLVSYPVWERDGLQYAIAFTSEAERLKAAPEWAMGLTIPGEAYFAALSLGLGFALNPGGSFGMALEPGDVERIRDRLTGAPAEEEQPGPGFHLGEPAQEDEALLAAARAAADKRPDVAELRRALLLVHEKGRQPQLVIGVMLDPMPTDKAATAALLEGMAADLPAGTTLAPIGARIDNPLSTYMLEKTEPFYRRASGPATP